MEVLQSQYPEYLVHRYTWRDRSYIRTSSGASGNKGHIDRMRLDSVASDIALLNAVFINQHEVDLEFVGKRLDIEDDPHNLKVLDEFFSSSGFLNQTTIKR